MPRLVRLSNHELAALAGPHADPIPKLGEGDCLFHALDQRRDSLPDSDAHRRKTVTRPSAAHLVHERRHDARAAAAERMTERNRAAVRIDAFLRNPELSDTGNRLRSERLINLDDVDLFDAQSGALQRLA